MWKAAHDTILLDTEGLGHVAADANHDIPIFTLAVLLSSSFVFNDKGAIREATLDNLSVVAKLCERVSMTSDKKATTAELAETFPLFISVPTYREPAHARCDDLHHAPGAS